MRELLVLTTALLITACAATVPPPPTPTPAPTVATAPPPVSRPENSIPQAAAPVPVPRPASAKVEPFDLRTLRGATESTVVTLIGQPDSIREQSPGKVWVYNHGACQIEVHMYPSVDLGSMGVLGTAILPPSLGDGDRDRCRRSLARRTARAE